MTRIRALAGCGLLVLLLAPVSGQQPAEFSFALTGDSIITRKLSVYTEPAFTRVIELIRGADAAFTNLEMLFHDYEPYAMNESGGTYMRAEPALVKELVWAGFDMVSRANNHTGDYGVLGMNLTTKYVAEAGLVQAGVGQSLAEAREAKFLETPKGRVALISVASTFPDHSRAGPHARRHAGAARPEPAALHDHHHGHARAAWRRCAQMAARSTAARRRRAGRDRRHVQLLRPPLHRRRHARHPHRAATRRISTRSPPSSGAPPAWPTTRSSRSTRTRAAAIACVPADFLVTFARAMVDAGADLFVGHGPHVLRGIEIYKGKPILYSLGDFIFQNETLLRLPSENYEPYDLGAARARQRLQRRALQLRQERLSRRSPDLGSGRRRAEVPRRAARPSSRCIRSRSDSARRAACAAGRCSRKASSDRRFSATSSKLSGGDGNEDPDPQRHRLRRAVAASKSTVRGATKRRHENTKNIENNSCFVISWLRGFFWAYFAATFAALQRDDAVCRLIAERLRRSVRPAHVHVGERRRGAETDDAHADRCWPDNCTRRARCASAGARPTVAVTSAPRLSRPFGSSTRSVSQCPRVGRDVVQQERRVIAIHDDDVHAAVVVDVAKRRRAARGDEGR